MALHVRQHGPRTLSGAVAAGVLSCGLCGCGSIATDTGLSAAQVRFVQVSPGAPEMDFYINGAGAAYGIGFESYTSYLPVSAGPVSFAASRKGFTQALVTVQGNLAGGRQYTAIVSHGLGSLQEHLFLDQDTAAPAGQTALRIVNEAEGIAGLVIYITPLQGGAPMALNLNGGAASTYVNMPATTGYTVIATVTDRNLNVPVKTVVVKAGSGTVHTIVFAGVGRSGIIGFALTDAESS